MNGNGELPQGWTDCWQLASDPAQSKPPQVTRSGFGSFDAAQPYQGVPLGSVYAWGGEMKAGKSRWVLALSAGRAFHGQRVAYMMTEMSPGDHFKRLLMMRSGLTLEQFTSRERAAEVKAASGWVKDYIGKRLAFKPVPQTLEDITKAAEWVGEGGHVVVDSVQGVMQGVANMNRGDAVEQAMRHIVALAQRTGAAFDIISEIGKPSNGGERSGAFDFTKHSSSIRQNCDAFNVVRAAEGTTQRVECMDQRHGPKQDFTILLSEQNHFPLLPPWEGGAP